MYLDFQPPKGTSLWSMMWDELTVASIVDPSVIKKSETMYLDVDIDHGPKYGHTVIWKKPDDVPQFFLPYSGPEGPDREKWLWHLAPPPQLHPASVQMEVDVKSSKTFSSNLWPTDRSDWELRSPGRVWTPAPTCAPTIDAILPPQRCNPTRAQSRCTRAEHLSAQASPAPCPLRPPFDL